MAAAMTTICLVGFPAEGVLPRELKNLCRFMPGFEGAHVAFAGVGIPSTLFVKFQSTELANGAMDTMHGVPFDVDNPQFTLKAEWARREMEVRPHSPLPAPLVAAPCESLPSYGRSPGGPVAAPAFHHHPAKRVGPTGTELVTIVVFGLQEKGLSAHDLDVYFREQPGFVQLQRNDRIDGMFVRFASPAYAEQALQDANAQRVGAEWARRNLDEERSGGTPASTHLTGGGGGGGRGGGGAPLAFGAYGGSTVSAAVAAYGGGGSAGYAAGPPSRQMGATGGELVTICILGLLGKSVSPEQVQDWFCQRPGFDRQQLNDRIGGLFVKFTSAHTAEQAMFEANQLGYGAEWARRNLDDDPSARVVPVPPPQHHHHQRLGAAMQQGPSYGLKGGGPPKRMRTSGSEVDTITILTIREKEQTHGDLQQWFAERPGYIALQLNDKIDAMFVKFSSRAAAEQAIEDARVNQIGAEWARRNLDL